MANTYIASFQHLVWSTKYRRKTIGRESRERLEKIMCGIATDIGVKPLAVYAMPEHVHLLVSMRATQTLSEVVGHVKRRSAKLFNETSNSHVHWQRGYGAFSVSRDHVQTVINYILNQEEHHRRKNFEKEYIEWLNKHQIDYNPDYVFD